MRQSTRSVLPLVVMLACAALLPTVSHAQAIAGRVRVALVNELTSPTARAEVVRYGDGQTDLILLRDRTSAEEDLLTALTTLEKSKAKRSVQSGRMRHIVIEGYLLDVHPKEGVRRRLTITVSKLRSQPLVRIGNRGSGRWMEFDGI